MHQQPRAAGAETIQVNPLPASLARVTPSRLHSHLPSRLPSRLALLSLVVALSGCSAIGGLFSSDSSDYRGGAAKAKPLEVPPDLSQLSRDSRYQVQGGVVSASGSPQPGAAVSTSATATAAPLGVALSNAGAMRLERAGQQRWLVVPLPPEQLWPALKTFWEQKGFSIEVEDAKAGTMETNWSMNRARLPNDAVRNTIGRLFGNLYDTGERDRYRTRIERAVGADGGSEVYISHRGSEEVYTSERKDSTTWRTRASDPQLEAEILSQLMVALGAKDEAAKQAVAAAGTPPERARPVTAAGPAPGARAPGAVSSGATSLEVDDPFDRAWRRVGLALDRGGFTVEDRDRAGGIYYVRYIDPKSAGKEEPGFWARLFGDTSNPQAAVRYRVALKGNGNKTDVTVQSSSGGAEVGENGRRIAALLVSELK